MTDKRYYLVRTRLASNLVLLQCLPNRVFSLHSVVEQIVEISRFLLCFMFIPFVTDV